MMAANTECRPAWEAQPAGAVGQSSWENETASSLPSVDSELDAVSTRVLYLVLIGPARLSVNPDARKFSG